MVAFEDDDICMAPFGNCAYWWESTDHYTVTKDDKLVLSSEGGHANGTCERVDTGAEALDDMYTYFVSENPLIIEEDEYTRLI